MRPKTTIPPSDMYCRITQERAQSGITDRNDCAVVAVAAACDVPYSVAHAALAAQGRKQFRGTRTGMTHAAVRALGFDVREVSAEAMIKQYPGSHKNLRNVTTHHPERFHAVWADGRRYLFTVAGHVLAVVNGQNCDWTKGRAKRVLWICEVTK